VNVLRSLEKLSDFDVVISFHDCRLCLDICKLLLLVAVFLVMSAKRKSNG
jgi:hypothetical protein